MISNLTILLINCAVHAMRIIKPFFVMFAVVVIIAEPIRAVTTDELAAFLGISSWHTEVDFPNDLYTVQILRFADGKIDDTDLGKMTKVVKSPNDVTIMVGTQDGKYRFMIINAGGSFGIPTSEPILDQTVSAHLSEKVREGDFILFGKPLDDHDGIHGLDDIHYYSKGYLLRIKKKP